MKVAIYVSNHGFGHAKRMSALADEFGKYGIYCYIITNRPAHLFDYLNPQFYELHSVSLDFGIKQEKWNGSV